MTTYTNNERPLPSTTTPTPTPQRRPTVSYPLLHLDSFSSDLFPSQLGPDSKSRRDTINEEDRQGQGDETGLRQPTSASFLRHSSSGTLTDQQASTPYDNVYEYIYGNDPRQQPSIPEGSSSRLPPPPSLALPALPDISPISPVYPLPSETMEASGSTSGGPSGPRPQSQSTRLGPALSIKIPQSPPPTRVAPPLRDSPGMPRRRTIVEHQGYQGVSLDVESSKDTQGRLNKKASMSDLNTSPTASSPTAKRSLPRPSEAMLLPAASTTWPIPNAPKPYQPQHQPQKSASILPIVSGLADAGPYPTTTPRQSAIGLGKPPSARAPAPKMQEEVCLECMMRDRDLADIDVIGPGCWSRQSDADWDELKWREEALLKSIGSQSTLSVPSIEDDASSDSESTSASNPSTAISSEDAENRRRLAMQKQQRMILRAKRREADGRILREVGWRGFKWEEGKNGEGMPRGFRGTVGGPLTVDAIKAVMTKYPKASEHRYEYLHNYLQHQWRLVLEIRSDASRRGHYRTPSEVHYNDSISSHEPITAGPRTSSVSWEQRSARDLREPVREPFTSPAVRPSPSTPTELTNSRSRPIVAPRPHTQLLPEAAERINPTPHSARSRYEKGISSPGALGSPQPDRWEDDDALWSPASAGDGSLRPFSFAVRAGATAGDGHGNGRKSLFGRWGGSVTSFFGGSQGGSGSMMDMHLGLDSDRRAAYPSSNQPHRDVYPRAVSMASPSRPSFFSKDSRTSVDQPRDPRALTKSISSSRLSQVVRHEQGVEEPKKKKGLKGLIQKMKPKSKRSSSGLIPPLPQSHSQQYTHDPGHSQGQGQGRGQGDSSTPLAPPPNMAYLSGDGQQRHHRNNSQSSMADSQSQGSNWKMRSVSAPIGGSSSGSQSASPTSSRYRRESYNSQARQGDRDRDQDQGQHVEMLHAPGPGGGQYQQRQMFTSPEPGLGQYQDERRTSNVTQPANGSGSGNGSGSSYPNPSFRTSTSKYASGSISNSSGVAPTIETPPMPLNATPYFSRPPSINSPATTFSPNMPSSNLNSSTNANNNVNRFKNLPPLPPTDDPNTRMASPDSIQVLNDQQSDFTTPNNRNRTPLYQQPTHMYDSGPYQTRQGQGMPRASFDRPTTTPRAEPSPRMVHSMYAQPSMGNSNLSFGSGRFPPFQGQGQMHGAYTGVPHGHGNGNGNGFVEGPSGNEKKGLKKGFKGFFGGAKAGRMA